MAEKGDATQVVKDGVAYEQSANPNGLKAQTPPPAGARSGTVADRGPAGIAAADANAIGTSLSLYAKEKVLLRNKGPQATFDLTRFGLNRGERTGGGKERTIMDEWLRVRSLRGAELTEMQGRLARAGFYGSADETGRFNYTPGKLDDATIEASTKWLVQSAREYTRTGADTDQVLDEMAAYHDQAGDLRPKRRGGGPGEVSVVEVELSDPHQLSSIGDTVGQTVLGRSLTAAEKIAFIDKVHTMQRDKGTDVIGARQDAINRNTESANATATAGGLDRQGADTLEPLVTTGIDAQSMLEDQLRAENPGAAEGMDMARAMEGVMSFIRGGQ